MIKALYIFKILKWSHYSRRYEELATIAVSAPSGERAIDVAVELGLCSRSVTFQAVGRTTCANEMNHFLQNQNEIF